MDFLQTFNELLVTYVPAGDTIWTILMFLIVLSVLVFIHELGHYLAARSVGICVETFSIGFGKELWGRTDSHGTHWKISILPLGGYVKMYGFEGGGSLDAIPISRRHEAFPFKSVWQRMWTVFAGPLANFVLAFVLLTMMMFSGEQQPVDSKDQSATVGMMMQGMPAANAGLEIGDKILSMDNSPIANWLNLVEIVRNNPEQEIPIKVQRSDEILNLQITPEKIELSNPDEAGRTIIGRIGVNPKVEFIIIEHGLIDSVRLGIEQTYDITAKTIEAIGGMIFGEVSADNLGGPIMIAEIAGSAGKQGFYMLSMLMVIISINLGLLNLFPIPVLDGGHLLYFIIEAVKGSPLNEKAQEYGYRFGIAAILMLMVFATFNDLRRMFTGFLE